MLNPFLFTLQNLQFLKQDFIGFRIDSSFFMWIISFISVCLLFCLLYFLGICIRQFIFRIHSSFTLQQALLSLALGYIFFCTGITLLGLFSLLYAFWIFGYIFIIIIITLIGTYHLSDKQSYYPKNIFPFFKKIHQANPLASIFLLLFIVLGLVRLLSPEIGVDAIYYHYDYPQEYLRIHSLMEVPLGTQIYLMTPQLGQMLYVIMIFFHLIPALRIIHFFFFLCTVCILLWLGSKKHITQLSVLPALLFSASPTVLGLIGSGYVDMQWVFCWLIIFSLFTEAPLTQSTILVSACVFGGILASKIQGLSFFITFISFFFIQEKRNFWRYAVLFILVSIIFPSLWYIRSFLITGQLFYSSVSSRLLTLIIPQYISFNAIKMKVFGLIINFNPFILISIVLTSLYSLFQKRIHRFFSQNVFAFVLLINFLLLPIYYYTGRYLLFVFSVLTTVTVQLPLSIFKNKYYQIILWGFTSCMFMYYFFNALLILPYGFTWANTNHYLTRVLTRNNASYYDFDMLFSPHIDQHDVIAFYSINGFLYANFMHVDVAYILKVHGSFTDLKKAGVTKLLIKHGDIQWFCTIWELTDCSPSAYQMIAVYPPAQQYLYKIR